MAQKKRYWLYSEGPLIRYHPKDLREARQIAMRFVKRQDNERVVLVVKSDGEPYAWKGNYDVVGRVEYDPAMRKYVWRIPGTWPAQTEILPSGSLKRRLRS